MGPARKSQVVGAAVDRALVQEFPQVEVGLPERRPFAAREPGLGAGDDADQQGGSASRSER